MVIFEFAIECIPSSADAPLGYMMGIVGFCAAHILAIVFVELDRKYIHQIFPYFDYNNFQFPSEKLML